MSILKSPNFWCLPLAAACCLVLAVRPARAQLTSDFLANSRLNSLMGLFEEIVLDTLGLDYWLDRLNAQLNDPCAALPVVFVTAPEPGWCEGTNGSELTALSAVIGENATGEMGIPNPMAIRQSIESNMDGVPYSPNVFQINREGHSILQANLAERIVTRLAIDSVLGDEGQQAMARALEMTAELVAATVSEAEAAREDISTQDVVKRLARIQAQQAMLVGLDRVDALQARVDTQFTNLNLVNLSRSLDEEASRARIEYAANAAKVLYLSAQAGLF